MKLSCEAMRKGITRMIDREVPDGMLDRYEEHLRSCASCRAALEEHLALRTLWADPPSIDSDPLDRRRVVEAARADLQAGKRWVDRLRGRVTTTDTVTASALAISIALLVLFLQGRADRPLPAGWDGCLPVYTMTELRTREAGMQIETEDGSETILWS